MPLKTYFANFVQVSLLLCLPAGFTACQSESTQAKTKPDTYVVISPVLVDSSFTREYVAEIQALQNVEIRSRVKGFVDKIYVDEGKSVTQGQLLFSLSTKGYNEEIIRAKAELKRAQAELTQAEVEIANAQILTDNNVVPKSQLEVARSKKESILAQMQEAHATIELANLNLGFTQIQAPFSGIIHRIPNKVGALIDEGTLLTRISNTSEMMVYFNVSENDYLTYTSQGESHKVVKLKMANGTMLPHPGRIETIDGEIDPGTGNLAFRARFPNPEKVLKHGSSGKVLVTKQLAQALLIPQQSTFEVQENLYVYTVNPHNVVQLRKIESSLRLGDMYVIQSGLSVSDKVLYEGIQLVREGDKITPLLQNLDHLSTSTLRIIR